MGLGWWSGQIDKTSEMPLDQVLDEKNGAYSYNWSSKTSIRRNRPMRY